MRVAAWTKNPAVHGEHGGSRGELGRSTLSGRHRHRQLPGRAAPSQALTGADGVPSAAAGFLQRALAVAKLRVWKGADAGEGGLVKRLADSKGSIRPASPCCAFVSE